MAQSLVKLTLESNQYERNLRNAQRQWNDFMKGMGVSVQKFTAVSAAVAGVTGALKVAKEAFFSNEKQLDEWNRTVESSKSVYNGFLSALNTGDISGFLSNIEQIISAAKSAYNALDELQTFKAYNQVQDARSRASYAKALDAYKTNPTAENKAALAAANQSVIDNIKQEQEFTKTAYTEALNKLANERGLKGQNRQDFIDMFQNKSYNEMLTIKNKYDEGKAGRQLYYGDRVLGGKIQNRDTGVWREMTEAEKKELEFARALNQLNDEQIKATQALGKQAEMLEEAIWQQDRAYNRLAGNNGKVGGATGGGSGGGKTSGRIKVGVTDNIEEKVRTQWDRENLRAIALSNTLKAPEETSGGSEVWKMMTQGAEESTNQIESLTAAFERLNEVEGVTLKSTVKESQKIEKSFDYAAEAVGSIGSALSLIEDPAAKVVGTIAQAIASIALGYSQATVAAAQTGNPYVWAAFAAAGLAQMVSMIATIYSATGYASGGEIKGNSFSGDNIPIMANAGEVVLTRAMANTLASSITNSESLSNLSWTIRMKGEDIYLTADRSQIRRGRGRILTSKG